MVCGDQKLKKLTKLILSQRLQKSEDQIRTSTGGYQTAQGRKSLIPGTPGDIVNPRPLGFVKPKTKTLASYSGNNYITNP